MSKVVEETYRDLLHPIKDPEKSFQVDIALLLQNYITSFIQGKVPPNFNSAALLLQGSSSIYSKKVEYLHNLATQLYQNLTKPKKDDQAKKDPVGKGKDKQKDSKFNDPFFSTEIKLGKNLSCLKRKTTAKSAVNKKGAKNAKNSFSIPVDLMPYEGEEIGDDFYDTNNDVVGKKGDFTLNKCRVTVSGWLMLPTVSSDKIPTENSPPDYSSFLGNISNLCSDDDNNDVGDCDMPESTPDEGCVMDIDTPSLSQQTSTPDMPMSQQTDEGVGSLTSTPFEQLSQPNSEAVDNTGTTPDCGSENIPMDGVIEALDEVSRSTRRSERQALKLRQLEEGNLDLLAEELNEEPPKADDEEIVVVKRAIQKKNTLNIPAKLRPGNENEARLERCSEFCARTYFVVDTSGIKNGLNVSLQLPAFKVNAKITAIWKERILNYQAAIRKDRKIDEEAEKPDVDIEVLSGSGVTGAEKLLSPPLEDNDIVIQNDPAPMEIVPENPEDPIPETDDPPEAEFSAAEASPPDDEDNAPNLEDIVQEQINIFTKDVAKRLQDTDITKRVHEWETELAPFLKELEEREEFDIHIYGVRIISAFKSENGAKKKKLTTTFRNFCKGMEKWQIHRYFMALLPLANIGNVELSTEPRPDGDEDILITLLSSKMHHLAIEEFSGNGEENVEASENDKSKLEDSGDAEKKLEDSGNAEKKLEDSGDANKKLEGSGDAKKKLEGSGNAKKKRKSSGKRKKKLDCSDNGEKNCD